MRSPSRFSSNAVALENEEWRSNVRRVSAKVATFSGFGSRDAVCPPVCSSWRGVQTKSGERNHLKRLLGEAARAYLPGLLPGMDIVFSARNAASTATLQTLAGDIRILLQRAKLLTAPPGTTNQIT